MISAAIMPKVAAGLGLATLVATAGFFIQGQRMHAWKLTAKAHEQTIANIAGEQERQNERVIAWAKDIEAKSKRIAINADQRYAQGYAEASAATERYIAAHRVRRPESGGGAIKAPALSVPDGTGVPEGAPADAVVVAADDVRICSELHRYAFEAYLWAQDVGKPVD